MAYYLSKYVGTYRVKTEVDLSTNDYPRNENGLLEQNDTYILCKKGRIYHYGRNVLQCYVNKLGVGRNVLKALGKDEKINVNIDDFTTKNGIVNIFNYQDFYKALEDTKIIFDIHETDEEVLWKFKDKDIELMAKYMIPQVSGASISPFATSNLPKRKYEISNDDLTIYKNILKENYKDDYLLIAHLTKDFISRIPKKYKEFKGKDMKAMQKKSCLKSKEFIHSINLWDEYIKYLKEKCKCK